MAVLTKSLSGSLSFYGLHWNVSSNVSLPTLTDIYANFTPYDSTPTSPAFTTSWLGEAVSSVTIGTDTYKFIGTYFRSNNLPVDAYYSGKNWMVSMELEGAHKRLVFCLNGVDLDHWIFLTSPDGTKLQMFNACNTEEGDYIPEGTSDNPVKYKIEDVYKSIGYYEPGSGSSHAPGEGAVHCPNYQLWVGADGAGYEELYNSSNPELLASASTFRAYLKKAAAVIPPSYLVSVAHHATASARGSVKVYDSTYRDDVKFIWRGLRDRSLSGGIYEAIKGSYTSCVLEPENDRNPYAPSSIKKALGLPYHPKTCTNWEHLQLRTSYGFPLNDTPTGKYATSLSSVQNSRWAYSSYGGNEDTCQVSSVHFRVCSISGTYFENLLDVDCTGISAYSSRLSVGTVFTIALHAETSDSPVPSSYTENYIVCMIDAVATSGTTTTLTVQVISSSFADSNVPITDTLNGSTFKHVTFAFYGTWGEASASMGSHSSTFSPDSIALGSNSPVVGALFQLGSYKDSPYAKDNEPTGGEGFTDSRFSPYYKQQDCILVAHTLQYVPGIYRPFTAPAGRTFIKGICGFTGTNDWRECYSVQDVDMIRRYCGDYTDDFLNQQFCITFTALAQHSGDTTVHINKFAFVSSGSYDLLNRASRKITIKRPTDTSESEISAFFNEDVPVGTVFKVFLDFTLLANVPKFDGNLSSGTSFVKRFTFPGSVSYPHFLFTASKVTHMFYADANSTYARSLNNVLYSNMSFGHIVCPNATDASYMFSGTCARCSSSTYAINNVEFRGDIVLPKATKVDCMFLNFALDSFFVTKNSSTTTLDTNIDLVFPKVYASICTSALSFFSQALAYNLNGSTPTGGTRSSVMSRLRSVHFPELYSDSIVYANGFMNNAIAWSDTLATASTQRGSIVELTIPRYKFKNSWASPGVLGNLMGQGPRSTGTSTAEPAYDWSSLPALKINIPFLGDSPHTWYDLNVETFGGTDRVLRNWMHQHFELHTDTPFERNKSIFHLDSTTFPGYWQPLSVTYVNTNELPDDDPTKVVDVSSLFDTTPTYPSGYSDLNLRHHPKVLYKNGYTYNVQQKANPSGVATDPDQYYYLEWDGTTITAHANL